MNKKRKKFVFSKKSSNFAPAFFMRLIHFIQFNPNKMYLDKAKKEEIFGKYGKSNSDTGSPESQIALFSYRISDLTEHLKKNRKDYTTARSLTQLVGKRRALLNYLYDRDISRDRAIIKALGLRR
jgi:small subunit ribosomal protein S15